MRNLAHAGRNARDTTLRVTKRRLRVTRGRFGVTKLRFGVTKPRPRVTKLRRCVTKHGSRVTELRPGVTKHRSRVTELRSRVTKDAVFRMIGRPISSHDAASVRRRRVLSRPASIAARGARVDSRELPDSPMRWGMQELPPFIPRVKGQAMTAAERQRRCRARGKGQHRGRYFTRAEIKEILSKQSAPAAAAPTAAGSAAAGSAATGAPASPGDITPRPALAPVHPRFLHWLLSAGH
jgi:hypothetical protein